MIEEDELKSTVREILYGKRWRTVAGEAQLSATAAEELSAQIMKAVTRYGSRKYSEGFDEGFAHGRDT